MTTSPPAAAKAPISSFEIIKEDNKIDDTLSPAGDLGVHSNDLELAADPRNSNEDIDPVALLSAPAGDEAQINNDEIASTSFCSCCCVCEPQRMGNYCCTMERVGNCWIIFPRLYQSTGFGIVGPHWWGLACTFGLLIGAGLYFTEKAVHISSNKVLSAKPIICILFLIVASIFLLFTGCTNPGIVTEANSGYTGVSSGRDWRWCQVCRYVKSFQKKTIFTCFLFSV